jgi:methionyl-tRNA synthetase
METPSTLPNVTYDDFAKLNFRVGTVKEAKPHPNADKLLVLQVDLGTETRQIVAGIRLHYEPASLIGKQIVVITNLEPRTLRGEVSHGMLLAASDGDKLSLVAPNPPIKEGSQVR